MTVRLAWHQSYPGGRMVARLGSIEVGAVFPPGTSPDRLPWVWRLWIRAGHPVAFEGRAQTEQAAKNALVGKIADWLREAGLKQEEPECSK